MTIGNRAESCDYGREHGMITEIVRFDTTELQGEQMEYFEAQVRDIVSDPRRYIDRGGVGTVHAVTEHLCIKVLEPRHESPRAHLMDLGQPVQVEAGIQRAVCGVEIAGVRAPWVYGYSKGSGENVPSIIIMERLDAVNLQRALNGDEQFPRDYDPDRFMSALESYLDYLHEQFGIIHGDLEPRNIMIDIQTGMPRVIDFGRSRVVSSMSEERRQQMIDRENEMFAEIYERLLQ
jgi:serine/threonine protein kinase